MKKSVRIRAAAVMSAFAFVSVFAGSCTIDVDKITSGFEDLGYDLNEAIGNTESTTSEASVQASETSETSAEITTAETTAEPTATPTPTSTPTPSATPTATPAPTATPTPTPLPERVDFSELTQDELFDSFTVDLEDFGESYVADNEVTIATFTGCRMLVESEEESNRNVITAVNLILDGFYNEAEGYYNRYINEGLAQSELEGDEAQIEATDVTVSYEYAGNGRVLSITMEYEVARGEEILAASSDYACFDMYTGQYVTLSAIADDVPGFTGFLAGALASSTEDERDDPADFSDIYIMAAENGVTVFGTKGGDLVSVDMASSDMAPWLNRYGLVLFPVIDEEEEAGEDADEEGSEEDADETEETEETGEDADETEETGEAEETEAEETEPSGTEETTEETEETRESEETQEAEETEDEQTEESETSETTRRRHTAF